MESKWKGEEKRERTRASLHPFTGIHGGAHGAAAGGSAWLARQLHRGEWKGMGVDDGGDCCGDGDQQHSRTQPSCSFATNETAVPLMLEQPAAPVGGVFLLV